MKMSGVAEKYRETAREYVKALETVKEARRKVAEAIIKYLIANSHDLNKCTELAISRELGLPRSIVRSILSELADMHVVEAKTAGNVKPYVFTQVGIGAAIDYLGLTFTKEEIRQLLGAKEEEVAEKRAGFISGCPFISRKVKGGYLRRYRGCGADLCLDTLVKRFFEYVNADTGKSGERTEKIKQAFGEDLLQELELLLPEFKSYEKLKYPPLPALPPGFNTLFQKIYDKIDQLAPDEIRKEVAAEIENDIKNVLNKLKKFASLLEELGYEGLRQHFKNITPTCNVLLLSTQKPDYKFHDEYLWATTLALRETCKIAQKLGASQKLIKEALLLAEALDTALEKRYRGKRAEKAGLLEWYAKTKT